MTSQAERTDTNEQSQKLSKDSTNQRHAEFAKEISWFFTMAKGLGIKVPDVTTATQVYEQALAHVPMKLINKAISRIWRTWKRASLPLPADLLETIKVELA